MAFYKSVRHRSTLRIVSSHAANGTSAPVQLHPGSQPDGDVSIFFPTFCAKFQPDEFAALPHAVAAGTCWRNWHRRDVTPHDGVVRPGHPLLLAILERTQSASSLRRLLRNPLGYVWLYGMRLRAPESGADPLVLDALGIGDLLHMTLDRALRISDLAAPLLRRMTRPDQRGARGEISHGCSGRMILRVLNPLPCNWE